MPLRYATFLLSTLAIGCGGKPGDDPLIVLTCWDADRRGQSEARWAALSLPPHTWVCIRPEAFRTWLESGQRADLLIGGPSWTYDELAGDGLLTPVESTGPAGWVPVARRGVRIEEAPPAGVRHAESWLPDPRSDPAARRAMEVALSGPSWADGYARLVRAASVVASAGSPVVGRSIVQESAAGGVAHLIEGGAVARGGRLEPAERMLAALSEDAPPNDSAPDALVGDLTADLLGATLIDVHDDLRTAARRIDAAGSPDAWAARLAEAPPWPPASILLLRDDPARADDLDTLAEELTVGLGSRAWLRASWDRPRRPIDGAFLAELAAVDDGRLAKSPGFRAWLRGEWAAWAGQWARWVGRRAGDPTGASR